MAIKKPPLPTTMEVAAGLRAVRDRIEEPQHWCQRRFHLGEYGDYHGWDLLGATMELDTVDLQLATQNALGIALGCPVSTVAPMWHLVDYNDAHTHTEIIAFLSRVITQMERV